MLEEIIRRTTPEFHEKKTQYFSPLAWFLVLLKLHGVFAFFRAISMFTEEWWGTGGS